jgi:hypothetical protein
MILCPGSEASLIFCNVLIKRYVPTYKSVALVSLFNEFLICSDHFNCPCGYAVI